MMKLLNTNNVKSDQNPAFFNEESVDYDLFIPWKNSYAGDAFFQWLENKFVDFEEDPIQEEQHILFFKNESTFAFRMDTEMLNIHPSLLWNYWKDCLKENGYVLKNSESMLKNKLMTNRYYLKPNSNYKIENNQMFGNITLEIIKNEALAKYIVMKCTWYNGFQYNNPLSSKELMQLMTR